MSYLENETPNPSENNLISDFYVCVNCDSLIEIISINEEDNTIEFKCLNKENIHSCKMKIGEYLNKIKNRKKEEIMTDKCKAHNKIDYESFCLNCNQHLCKQCLELRSHIYHRKINIKEILLTTNEEEIVNEIIRYYEEKEEEIQKNNINKKIDRKDNNDMNNNEIKYNEKEIINKKLNKKEDFKNMKDLINIIYHAYDKTSNNYYNIMNLYNLIICCMENNKDIKENIVKLKLKGDELKKFYEVKKDKADSFEDELESIISEYNKKIDNLYQKFQEESYNQNFIIKRMNLEKIQNYDEGIYIGNIENGLKEGRGKLFLKNGDIYEGEWKNDKKEGKGIYYFQTGNKYEGDFKNDKQHGIGIYFLEGGIYEGDFKEGQFDGNAAIYYDNGDIEIGKFQKDKKIGKHVILKVNGEIKTATF